MSQRVKLLQLVLQLDYGGAESMVVLQSLHLDRARFDVHVWSLDRGGGNVERLRAAGIPVQVLGKGLGFSAAFLHRFRQMLRSERYDIIHTHNMTPGRWAAVASTGIGPTPVRVRTEHTFHEDARVAQAIDHAWTGGFFAATVGVCETITRSHQAIDPLWRSRYHTLRNAIELDAPMLETTAARKRLGLPDGTRAIVNLGNLRPAKAQSDLVEAFAQIAPRHPGTILVIIGEGPLRSDLEAQVTRSGLAGRVLFPGHRADAAELLSAADVVVQSSVREGMPVSLLEAARARRPIVATDVGGTCEFIIDGETGLLTPPGDPVGLGRVISDALDDPSRGLMMVEAAYRKLTSLHDVRKVAGEAERLYLDLLAGRLKGAGVYPPARSS